MAIDRDAFKRVLAHWASGITVVTCRREGGIHGMTASAFTSVSLDPPLVSVCVACHNKTHQYLLEQRAFGVHVLRADMQEISNRCAGFLGEEAHWLLDLSHHTEVTGAPILDEALAWMDCSLWQAYDGGDHTIFVGEIQAGEACEAQVGGPLLWFNRGYRRLAEDP